MMQPSRWLALTFALLFTLALGHAQDQSADKEKKVAEILKLVKALKYQHGQINLPAGWPN